MMPEIKVGDMVYHKLYKKTFKVSHIFENSITCMADDYYGNEWEIELEHLIHKEWV
jgi:hypothetical protein